MSPFAPLNNYFVWFSCRYDWTIVLVSKYVPLSRRPDVGFIAPSLQLFVCIAEPVIRLSWKTDMWLRWTPRFDAPQLCGIRPGMFDRWLQNRMAGVLLRSGSRCATKTHSYAACCASVGTLLSGEGGINSNSRCSLVVIRAIEELPDLNLSIRLCPNMVIMQSIDLQKQYKYNDIKIYTIAPFLAKLLTRVWQSA